METESRVRRAQKGCRESREALARHWLRPAYGVALAHTRHAADAEEVVQEAFLRAFRSLRSLRRPERFGPWLVRIVKNVARDRGRRPREQSLHDPSDLAAGSGADEGSRFADDAVVAAWRDLPEDERLIVWLKVVDGMTVRELAHLLGSSKSTVDRTFRRGMARLREEMARC